MKQTKNCLAYDVRKHRLDKIKCQICGKHVTISNISRHKKQHLEKRQENQINCIICGKYVTISNISRHKKQHKRQENKIECTICGKYVTKSNMARHKKQHLREDESIKCTICGKYVTKSNLARHKKQHTWSIKCYVYDSYTYLSDSCISFCNRVRHNNLMRQDRVAEGDILKLQFRTHPILYIKYCLNKYVPFVYLSYSS
jgi:ribosomal protein L44E